MEEWSPYRILIVEDDENIAELIRINMTRAGFKAMCASSGEDGLELLQEGTFDLIILDIALPGMSGLEVCRILRVRRPDVAIIMVTARGTDLDKIRGLELGADDYVVKPFNPEELTARVRSVLRRVRRAPAAPSLRLDRGGRRVFLLGREIHMTTKEFDLLLYLYERPGKVASREELLRAVWGQDFWGEEKTLDVHIRRLREKLEEDPSSPKRIVTVWGVGFRYDGEEDQ
jgi:DNA-binding response OmpR family regulator